MLLHMSGKGSGRGTALTIKMCGLELLREDSRIELWLRFNASAPRYYAFLQQTDRCICCVEIQWLSGQDDVTECYCMLLMLWHANVALY